MPPPLSAVSAIAGLPDDELTREVDLDGRKASLHFILYDLLRHEQGLAVAIDPERPQLSRILDLAQMAYGDLVGLLAGRDDALLDSARDGEWTLRDLLRHAIAVELRYAAQIEYSATRRDDEPVAIPADRLPCDRLSPPEPEFAASRTEGIAQVLELLGVARSATSRRLATIPDSALERTSLWGTVEMTARMRAHQIAVHINEAAVQAEKMLGADARGSEARRIIRQCCAMRGLHEPWSDATARSVLDARYSEIARNGELDGVNGDRMSR